SRRGGSRQGLSQWRRADGITGTGSPQLHSRAGAGTAELAGQRQGGGAEADVCESATCGRRTQQAAPETTQRIDRAKLCAPVRNRWDAAVTSARPGQHSEATAGTRSRVQPFADPAENLGSGQAPAVTGGLFAAFRSHFPLVFVVLGDTLANWTEIGELCVAKQLFAAAARRAFGKSWVTRDPPRPQETLTSATGCQYYWVIKLVPELIV